MSTNQVKVEVSEDTVTVKIPVSVARKAGIPKGSVPEVVLLKEGLFVSANADFADAMRAYQRAATQYEGALRRLAEGEEPE